MSKTLPQAAKKTPPGALKTSMTMAYALSGTRRIADGGLSDRHYYQKIGKITTGVAKKAGIEPGDIVISKNALAHIKNRHEPEISALGIDYLAYVKLIATQFNRIYVGTGDSYLLVVYPHDGSLTHVAAIQANYSVKKGFWEVITAQPRQVSHLNEKNKRWQNRK